MKKCFSDFRKSLLFAAFNTLIFLLPNLGWAKDPAIGRAEAVARMSPADFKAQTLRFKIIRSRSLILYFQDILPHKGNSYFHMAELAEVTTLQAFKNAQKGTSGISKFMGDGKQPEKFWLPTRNNSSSSIENLPKDKKEIFTYWGSYIAAVNILENTLQPVLTGSILVGSIEKEIEPDKLPLFKNAMTHIRYIRNEYSKRIQEFEDGNEFLNHMNQKMNIKFLAQIGRNFVPHAEALTSSDKKSIVLEYSKTIGNLAKSQDSRGSWKKINGEIQIWNPNSGGLQGKNLHKALNSVDLVDSGDIDGVENSFESLLRLEIGYEFIEAILKKLVGSK